MKLTRRGLLAAIGVAPAAAKVEAGERKQPKAAATTGISMNSGSHVWTPRGREMEVINSDAFETAFWGWPATGKTEAGLMFLMAGRDSFYVNQPDYRGLVITPSQMAANEWMRRAKEAYGSTGARFMDHPRSVRFPNGAEINVTRGEYEYLPTMQGCIFQQIVFDGWVPEVASEYAQILWMARSYKIGMKPRVLIASSPQVAPEWAVLRFGKKDRHTGCNGFSERQTIYTEDPVIEVDAQFRAICRGICQFRC
jgi:hypothetical protein